MIQEEALVTKVKDGVVYVRSGRRQSCGSCGAKDSCATTVLSPLFKQLQMELPLKTKRNIKVGDIVILGIEPQFLLKSSILLYLVPLVALIVGAIAGDYLSSLFFPEFKELIATLFGLLSIASVFVYRWLNPANTDAISNIKILSVKTQTATVIMPT